MQRKNEVISEVYKKFLLSKTQTFAKIKKDPLHSDLGITKADVDKWFLRSPHTSGAKRDYKQNSFVAPGPKYEYQIDLFNYTQKYYDKPVETSALLCIDIFTKQIEVIPLKDKTGKSWRSAMDELIKKMGKPQVIMSDPDTAITSNEMEAFFLANKDIKHIMTRRHAAFAERAIRTFKDELNKRVSLDTTVPWTHYISAILKRLNTGKSGDDDEAHVSRATKFTPEDAAKAENWFDVHNNMALKAMRNRKYPQIDVGDRVRVYKQRNVHTKEWEGDFKPHIETVTKITQSLGQTFYKVTGATKEHIRSDIVLVDKKDPEAAIPKEPAPHVSHKMKRILARDKIAV